MVDQPEFKAEQSLDQDAGVGELPFTLADAKETDLPGKTEEKPSDHGDEINFGEPGSQVYLLSRQDFIDGVGPITRLYGDSVNDKVRSAKFQERMGKLYFQEDPQTFLDLAKVGEGLTQNPPSSPEAIGQGLADAAISAVERQLQRGNGDLGSDEMQNIQLTVAGMMIAARSTFDQADVENQTKLMVDALDTKFQEYGLPIRGIIWGDTKEPGLVAAPPGTEIDRHNFLP